MIFSFTYLLRTQNRRGGSFWETLVFLLCSSGSLHLENWSKVPSCPLYCCCVLDFTFCFPALTDLHTLSASSLSFSNGSLRCCLLVLSLVHDPSPFKLELSSWASCSSITSLVSIAETVSHKQHNVVNLVLNPLVDSGDLWLGQKKKKKRSCWEITGLNPHQQLSSSAQMNRDVDILANCLSAFFTELEPAVWGALNSMRTGQWELSWSLATAHDRRSGAQDFTLNGRFLLQQERWCHQCYSGKTRVIMLLQLLWKMKEDQARRRPVRWTIWSGVSVKLPPYNLHQTAEFGLFYQDAVLSASLTGWAGRKKTSLLPTVNQQHIWTPEHKDLKERP